MRRPGVARTDWRGACDKPCICPQGRQHIMPITRIWPARSVRLEAPSLRNAALCEMHGSKPRDRPGAEREAKPEKQSNRDAFTGARECSGRPVQTGQIQARGFSSSARPRSALSQQSSPGKPDEQNAFAFVGEDNQEQASGGASDRLTTYQQPEEQQQRGVLLGVGPAVFCRAGQSAAR